MSRTGCRDGEARQALGGAGLESVTALSTCIDSSRQIKLCEQRKNEYWFSSIQKESVLSTSALSDKKQQIKETVLCLPPLPIPALPPSCRFFVIITDVLNIEFHSVRTRRLCATQDDV